MIRCREGRAECRADGLRVHADAFHIVLFARYMYFGVEELEVFTLLSAFAVKKRI